MEDRRGEAEGEGSQYEAADPTKPISELPPKQTARTTIEQARDLYLTEKRLQGIDSTAQKKHERELARLVSFLSKGRKMFPHEITLQDLTAFRAGWETLYPSSLTRSKVQERLRGFLRTVSMGE